MPGVLVAFEGIDGSGKTTQAALLADWLDSLGLKVVRTKEPTAGPWGQKIRASKVNGRLPADVELDAFLNDRREHTTNLVKPALARGEVVIVDRYYYSTAAYQGARGQDPRELLARNRAFAPKPELVVLVDIDPRRGLERIHTRGIGQDTFETLDELTKARTIFLSLDEPHILRVDGSASIEKIRGDVAFVLAKGPLAPLLRAAGAEAQEVAQRAEAIARDAGIAADAKGAAFGAWLQAKK